MSGRLTTPSPRVSRRTFLTGSAALAAGVTLYAAEVARHEIDITHTVVKVRRLPTGFEGLRITQLSDIHLDEYTEPFFLERIVKHVNALAPDVVLLTGDFITRGALTFVAVNHAVQRCAELLQTIQCSEKYAVLGNHDVSVSAPLVISALFTHRIPVLQNRFVVLSRGGDHLSLSGTADPGTDIPDLNRAIPAEPQGPVILMAHAPDFADTVAAHPRGPQVDLMLSGHSHGGQIRLPLIGPVILPPLGRKYVQGAYQLGRMQLYVNRGIGTVGLPLRLNCAPEISTFTLQAN